MSKKKILGLDVSTTTIGIAIVEFEKYISDAKLIHTEYYKPNKKTDEINRLKEAVDYILKIAEKFKVDDVAVEEYIKFMKGSSGASTVIPLAIINTTLRLFIYEKLNIMPFVYNVLTIRHALKFDKKLPAKEDIPEIVARHLNINFPYEYKINRKTKQQDIKIESYDVADSVAVALAHIKNTTEIKPLKNKRSRLNKKKVS